MYVEQTTTVETVYVQHVDISGAVFNNGIYAVTAGNPVSIRMHSDPSVQLNCTCAGLTFIPNDTNTEVTVDFPDKNAKYNISITYGENESCNITVDVTEAPKLQFSERQVENLVTMVLRTVNERIQNRIIQTVTTGDTKHVASSAAVESAIYAVQSAVDDVQSAVDEVASETAANLVTSKGYTDEQINALREAMMGMNHWDIVSITGDLPTEPDDRTIYLQRDSSDDLTWEMNIISTKGDGSKEWITIGDTSIDLANYWSKDNVEGIVNALFGSEVFNTKVVESINNVLAQYTEDTLDLRYWKQDDITSLITTLLAEDSFKTGVLDAMSGSFFKKDSISDALAIIDAIINTDADPVVTIEEDGTELTTYANGDTKRVKPDGVIIETFHSGNKTTTKTSTPDGNGGYTVSTTDSFSASVVPSGGSGAIYRSNYTPGYNNSPVRKLLEVLMNMGFTNCKVDDSLEKLAEGFGNYYPHEAIIAKLRESAALKRISGNMIFSDSNNASKGFDEIYAQLDTLKEIFEVSTLNRESVTVAVNKMVNNATPISDDQLNTLISRATAATEPDLT